MSIECRDAGRWAMLESWQRYGRKPAESGLRRATSAVDTKSMPAMKRTRNGMGISLLDVTR
jgi:hypothetical protein